MAVRVALRVIGRGWPQPSQPRLSWYPCIWRTRRHSRGASPLEAQARRQTWVGIPKSRAASGRRAASLRNNVPVADETVRLRGGCHNRRDWPLAIFAAGQAGFDDHQDPLEGW